MKNSTFKILTTIFLSLFIYVANAQTADITVCENGSLNLRTDVTLPDGQAPDGTTGSFYTWTGTNGVNIVDFAPGSNPNGPSNKITADFTGIPAGTFVTITVIETNGTCVGDPVTYVVEVIAGPTAPTIDFSPTICSGDDAIFTVNGTPGNVFTYTINGGPTQTGTIGAGGDVDIIIPGATTNTTIVITSIATTGTTACTSTVNVTATIVVTAQPTTSAIEAF